MVFPPVFAVKFPAALLPNREAELCGLEDRIQEPVSIKLPTQPAKNRLAV
jgi:hypothetical protein